MVITLQLSCLVIFFPYWTCVCVCMWCPIFCVSLFSFWLKERSVLNQHVQLVNPSTIESHSIRHVKLHPDPKKQATAAPCTIQKECVYKHWVCECTFYKSNVCLSVCVCIANVYARVCMNVTGLCAVFACVCVYIFVSVCVHTCACISSVWGQCSGNFESGGVPQPRRL